MNWKRLYTSATPEERLEILLHMMKVVEERQQRVVFTGVGWVRDRRRGYQAHFLRDRRTGWHTLLRAASLLGFASILITVSATTFALAIHAPAQLGGPALFFYATSMLGVIMFKPNKKARPSRGAALTLCQ